MSLKRAVISLSGGLDSASLLAYLMCHKEYEFFHCYGFLYGQRHKVEIEKATQLVEFLKTKGFPVSFELIDVTDAFSDSQSALSGTSGKEVPKNSYSLEVSKATVVENRNIIFSSIIYGKALAISKKYETKVDITLGIHSGDHGVYPDTTKESQEMAKELFRISNWGSENVDYVAPFTELSKSQVLGRGLESLLHLGIDYKDFYSMTSSCYEPMEYHGKSYSCGLCATCRDRLKAFDDYGLEDPALYTPKFKSLSKSSS